MPPFNETMSQRKKKNARTPLAMREQNISYYRGVAQGVHCIATDNLHNQSAVQSLPLLGHVKLIANVNALTSRIHLFCSTSSSSKTRIKAHQQKQMIN